MPQIPTIASILSFSPCRAPHHVPTCFTLSHSSCSHLPSRPTQSIPHPTPASSLRSRASLELLGSLPPLLAPAEHHPIARHSKVWHSTRVPLPPIKAIGEGATWQRAAGCWVRRICPFPGVPCCIFQLSNLPGSLFIPKEQAGREQQTDL